MEEEKTFYKKSENELEWAAYEFTYHHKDVRWLASFWVVAVALFTSMLMAKNLFGAAVIALFAAVLYMYATKQPDIANCKINGRGVIFNDRLFPFSSISSFWIIYEPPVKELIIISRHRVVPQIVIPLENANPADIREMMLRAAILEKEEEEPIANIIARRLRF